MILAVRLVVFALVASVGPIGSADLPITAPDGWSSKKQEGGLVLSPRDLPTGSLYTIVVPDLAGKPGPLDDLMGTGLALLNQMGAFKPAADPQKGTTDGGWDYKLVAGALEQTDKAMFAQAVALKKGDEGGLILVLADSVATASKYTDDFAAMLKRIGAPSAGPKPTGAVDLQFTTPPGWTAKPGNGSLTLECWENKDDNFYGSRRFLQLLILPSRPIAGDYRSTFKSAWDSIVRPVFQMTIMPLPLVRRLNSGAVCAFDGGTGKTKEGKEIECVLYVVMQGDRAVPVLGLYTGLAESVEKAVSLFLNSAKIAGASAARSRVFDPAEMAGTWRQSSVSLANYVTSSGAYAGDASIATGETYELHADGTFMSSFAAIRSSGSVREKITGKWRVADDLLILEGGSNTYKYRVYGYGDDPKLGRFLVISMFSSSEEHLEFAVPRRPGSANWLKKQG